MYKFLLAIPVIVSLWYNNAKADEVVIDIDKSVELIINAYEGK